MYGETNQLAFRVQCHFQPDGSPGRGELDRIAQQIYQNLFHAAFVRPDQVEVRGCRKSHVEVFCQRRLPDHLQAGVAQLFYVHPGGLQLALASFDLCQIEDVVNHRKQVFAAGRDHIKCPGLAFVDLAIYLVLQGFHDGNDGIERGAQFMAHVRQKLVLGAHRPCQFGVGGTQLSRAFLNAPGEIHALIVEDFIGFLAAERTGDDLVVQAE